MLLRPSINVLLSTYRIPPPHYRSLPVGRFALQKTSRLGHLFPYPSVRSESNMSNPDLIEQAKKTAAQRAVDDYFDLSFARVGIGSGSTIKYIVDAIREKVHKAGNSSLQFVPTGSGSKSLVDNAGLNALSYEDIPDGKHLDVAFDGADEVDDELNLIKGGGLCLFQEKLVACRARKFIVVAGTYCILSRRLIE